MSIIVQSKKWLQSWIVPWFVGGTVFFLVASTASHYGVTWDEPGYFHATELEIQWFADFGKNLLAGRVAESIGDDTIKTAWRWNPSLVPHPPFSRLLSGLTKAVFSPFMDKFTAYRLAPALFFALLVTVMYLWMAAVFDRATGLFSAVSLVLFPNLFGFAHFAVTDMPLTAMWFLTVYCFWKGLKDWKWSLLLGVVWGLALATKFPAFLLPIPLLLWAHLYHRQSYHNNVFSMVFLSPLVMIACQPYLWHRTPTRIAEFILASVSRAYSIKTSYTSYFFGQLYLSSGLPWYYSFFMTAVTIPETILLLIFVGLIAMAWTKPQREVVVLFLFNAGFILVMGLFPGAVLYDVNRLMLPVLPFLAGIAGAGFFFLTRWLIEHSQRIMMLQRVKYLRAKLIGTVSLLVLFPPAFDLMVYHPFELSYYNRLVGGIRGAYERGLEVTYFMEAFTPKFIKYLNEELPRNAVINASISNFMFEYYQKENRLRRDIRITDKEDFDYYILLVRQSTFSKFERDWFTTIPHPYDAFRFDGVPLIMIYKAEQ